MGDFAGGGAARHVADGQAGEVRHQGKRPLPQCDLPRRGERSSVCLFAVFNVLGYGGGVRDVRENLAGDDPRENVPLPTAQSVETQREAR